MAWWLWLTLGVVLAVAEVFTGTFVLVMLAAGALAAALVAALGVPVGIQALVFAAVSAAALWLARPALRRHLHQGGSDTPIGMAQLEGASALVLEDVDAEHGLVKIGGEIWTARAYDATQLFTAGERVRVIEVKGATALVWRG